MVDSDRAMKERAYGYEGEHGGGAAHGGSEPGDMGVGPDDKDEKDGLEDAQAWKCVQGF